MGVEIVFSTNTAYASTAYVVQEPVEHDVVAAVDDPNRANYELLYITNVGNKAAENCGFYISPCGQEVSPTYLSEYTEIMSWVTDAGTDGVYTIQGDSETTAFEVLIGTGQIQDYTDTTRRHEYTSGTSLLNMIPLQDMNGIYGNALNSIHDTTPGLQPELYILVIAPLSEPAGIYNFDWHFYYEEAV